MTTTEPLPTTIADYLAVYLDNTSPKRLEGWCTPEKATALATHILTHRPLTALEIGVYAGRSLFAMALALKASASPTGCGQVLGIDPWSAAASVSGFETDPANRDWWSRLDHSSIYQQCLSTRTTLSLDNVHLFRGTAAQAAVALRFAHPKPFLDLLHIDGNHSEASALFDVEAFVPMVRPGGLVVFDDTDWSTTKKAQVRLAELTSPGFMVGACGFFTRLTPEPPQPTLAS